MRPQGGKYSKKVREHLQERKFHFHVPSRGKGANMDSASGESEKQKSTRSCMGYLQERKISLPYHRPARYDDLLTIRTRIEALPSVRIGFDYTIMNEAGEVLCEAHTTLVFVDRVTMKPRRAPDALVQALQRIGDH
jgi:YbgC/YbaW family acyl-CoA thioester hydrolase